MILEHRTTLEYNTETHWEHWQYLMILEHCTALHWNAGQRWNTRILDAAGTPDKFRMLEYWKTFEY
ncbi:hypothetical protein Glove_232g209 [Diversispora epigaea]|uniref:Uncharacterized protein n=1 Tax=Diversispora epigaea TaxID=1348612 RepID=A0A397IJ66_9GLOM|nr:hypothetical protein Glove_232g209 [Diversispora epigaea]